MSYDWYTNPDLSDSPVDPASYTIASETDVLTFYGYRDTNGSSSSTDAKLFGILRVTRSSFVTVSLPKVLTAILSVATPSGSRQQAYAKHGSHPLDKPSLFHWSHDFSPYFPCPFRLLDILSKSSLV